MMKNETLSPELFRSAEEMMLATCERLITFGPSRADHRRELEIYRTLLTTGGMLTVTGISHVTHRLELIWHFIEQDQA